MIKASNPLKIILVQPFKNLLQYPSFFLLMFIICFAERIIKLVKSTYHWNLQLPPFWRISADSSSLLLFQFPDTIFKKVGDHHLLVMIVILFVAKEVLSLWPASDMRRMHRETRGRFGILAAVAAIGRQGLAWYLLALLIWCGTIAGWCALIFGICCLGWRHHPDGKWLWGLGIAIAFSAPSVLAGFSFASRLAVSSTGTVIQKLHLLFKPLTAWRVAWRSWLFFSAWFVIEALFIAGTTLYIFPRMNSPAIRFTVAVLLATPFYAYLEMAAFKLFLIVYAKFPLIQEEYKRYYSA